MDQKTKDWTKASDDDILIADLIIESGLKDSTEEKKAELLAKMSDIAQKAIIKRVWESLSQSQQEKFQELLKTQSFEKIESFLKKNISGYDDLARQEIVKFKRAMLTGDIA